MLGGAWVRILPPGVVLLIHRPEQVWCRSRITTAAHHPDLHARLTRPLKSPCSILLPPRDQFPYLDLDILNVWLGNLLSALNLVTKQPHATYGHLDSVRVRFASKCHLSLVLEGEARTQMCQRTRWCLPSINTFDTYNSLILCVCRGKPDRLLLMM